jgi:hypothetical protein
MSQIYFIGVTHYMFRTVFPSIIRSLRLYIQQPNRYCCLQADSSICLVAVYTVLNSSSQQYLFDCCMYSLKLKQSAVSVWLLYVQS